jgi:ankyrin repeat protein
MSVLLGYLQKNLTDFDKRTALHRAVMNARILCVSYLLGIAADPNLEDRWGNTALDVALQGESTYHMYAMC